MTVLVLKLAMSLVASAAPGVAILIRMGGN